MHKTERYIPPRFTVYRHDKNDQNSEFIRAGGLAILVDSKLKSVRMKQYENINIERMCVKVWFNKHPVIIYLAYVQVVFERLYLNTMQCVLKAY